MLILYDICVFWFDFGCCAPNGCHNWVSWVTISLTIGSLPLSRTMRLRAAAMSSWKACLDKDLQKHFHGLLQNKVALIIDRGAVWLWPWLKNGSSIEPTSLGHKVSQPVEVCDFSLSQSCLKTFQGKFFTRALYAIETWDWNRMSGFQRWDPHRNNFLLFREAEPQTRCIWRHAGTWLTSTWSQDISGIQKAAGVCLLLVGQTSHLQLVHDKNDATGYQKKNQRDLRFASSTPEKKKHELPTTTPWGSPPRHEWIQQELQLGAQIGKSTDW